MIEATEAIQRAYAEAWFRALGLEPEDVERMVAAELRDPMPWRLAALQAVLDLIERDHCMKAKDHVYHPLNRPREWPAGRGGKHPHYCLRCSDGNTAGPGCDMCRSTGFDQTPYPDCQDCKEAHTQRTEGL